MEASKRCEAVEHVMTCFCKGGVRMGSPLLPVGREMAEIPASFALMPGSWSARVRQMAACVWFC